MASFGSRMAFPLLFVGIIAHFPPLQTLGILLFASYVLFALVTLPVEFNASRRALVSLREGGVLNVQEGAQAREVLTAAALTYVASAAIAIMQLLYLLSRRR